LKFVVTGNNWANVTLDEFMECHHNLAINRQTRMLANLSIVGCYNTTLFTDQKQRRSLLLESAIANLKQMAFFGLLENQSESQLLFERTFGVHFTSNFAQANATHAQEAEVTEDQLNRIIQLNWLDVQLYSYAKQLFDVRVLKAVSNKNLITEDIENKEHMQDFTHDELADNSYVGENEEDSEDEEDDLNDLQ
jgi:Sulfotransferase family